MVVLGVIILIVVAVVAVIIVRQGGDPVALDLPGFDVDTTAAGVFGIGAACALLALLGLALMVGGVRRSNRRRKEVKQLRREAESQPATSTRDTSRDSGGPPARSGGGTGKSTRTSPGTRSDGGDTDHRTSAPRD
ncbi:hypothetical protein BH20ACT6_BH20ACT6_24510 [soil metagenome]